MHLARALRYSLLLVLTLDDSLLPSTYQGLPNLLSAVLRVCGAPQVVP